ncbi:ATP-binding cassette domain-containing protein [Paenibacillus kribbensis]|uniref:ATP-binding cassette domain-containing protein n=1 Tax=Paenibacillus kribbensis TaxID=172713 RepID=UPI002119A38D|nr:ABC transporter ATP-binding protein [Paenibacillus kribbensis]
MMNLLEIAGLHLKSGQGTIVRDLDLSVSAGQCHALIGESGGGKSMTSLSIGDLLPATVWVESGKIEWCGSSLLALSKKDRERLRGKEIAYVFQDYASVLTPFMTIGKQLDETLKAHHMQDMLDMPERKNRKERIVQALEHVRLPKEIYNRYPFQLSGGQLQRVSLAVVIMLEPKLLILDEPTTALDQTNANEILRIISELKERTRCGILFISHNLRNVKRYADQVTVMREGQVIETGSTLPLLNTPKQSYTRRLIEAIPSLRPSTEAVHESI